MKIIVFGQTGQVARELALLPGTQCLGRSDADLGDPAACAAAIHARRPEAVINAAAYTAVDRAETDEDIALTINAHAPAAMAQACADLGIPLVHISTDYVFDGSGDAPWTPAASTGPLGAYGRTKLAGERAVRAAGGVHAIVRTSWVVSAHGTNFVKTMLRLGAERDALSIVADQIGGPTGAREIAAACHAIATQLVQDADKSGTYHFAGAPACSWAGFARRIFARAQIDCTVTDIPSAAYPTLARRPLNSRLDCTGLFATFAIVQPQWDDTLTHILTELGQLHDNA
jgi:dTDP-4-dehydrorhamnose reductase